MFKKLKKLWYAFMFGLRGTETEALGQKSSSISENDGIHEVIQSRRLSDALIKGEVTEEVEELRYRDYTVSNESKKYEYIGEGEAVKKEEVPIDYNNFSFAQENTVICNGVLDEIHRVGEYGRDTYTLNIIYDVIPRFRLEKYCKMIDVEFTDGVPVITLHFSSMSDKYDVTSKQFINEFSKILENIEYFKDNHDFCSSLLEINFITYKSYGEDDLIAYKFQGLTCIGVINDSLEYRLLFKADSFSRENLIAKFYSDTMAKKYEQHASKKLEYNFYEDKRTETCDICGEEMSVYDADITRGTFGYSMCIKCLEKKLENDVVGLDI